MLQVECGCFCYPCCECSAVPEGHRMCDGPESEFPFRVTGSYEPGDDVPSDATLMGHTWYTYERKAKSTW